MADATYRSVLLDEVQGAVEAAGADAGVAAHYGDPLREQRALARGTAVADLSHRGVLTVEGPDRLTWLTTLSSQVLTDLVPGDSAETLFLSVQGRVEFAPHVLDDGVRTWLIVEAHHAAPLRDWLDRMRFALRVDVRDRTAEVAVIGATTVPDHLRAASAELYAALDGLPREVTAPGAEQKKTEGEPQRAEAELHPVALPLMWSDPWPGVVRGGWAYGVVQGHPAEQTTWHEVLVARDRLVEVLTGPVADGLGLAGSWAAEALRIETWRPRMGADTDERTVPHELDWLRTAVHLEKGCYKGQETVARVHNLGHPPRRLVFLDLDGSEHTVPPAQSEVLLGERVVGRVTSAQLHHEAGPVALAVVKRSVDPAADLTVRAPQPETPEISETTPAPGAAGTTDQAREQWAAAQTVVVPPEAGQTVQREKGFLRGPR
ncbi:MAG: folate-binding protein [Kocuria sp.]|nr:folate-binding protein [Kocuria sp.]MDO5617423.1 folate-binding protein [Kocuria sp.]